MLAAQNIKFQAYLGNKKDNRNYYQINPDKALIIPAGAKYSFKAKNGLFIPCLLKSKTKTEAAITLIRCGTPRIVPNDSIIAHNKELINKPYRHTTRNNYTILLVLSALGRCLTCQVTTYGGNNNIIQ